jgi:hypothetical protein
MECICVNIELARRPKTGFVSGVEIGFVLDGKGVKANALILAILDKRNLVRG